MNIYHYVPDSRISVLIKAGNHQQSKNIAKKSIYIYQKKAKWQDNFCTSGLLTYANLSDYPCGHST
jgi:hypothetical protein